MVAVPTPGAVSVRPIADRLAEITRATWRTRENFPTALRVSSSPIVAASSSTSGVTVSVSVSFATRSIWSRVVLSIRDDARLKPPLCICSMVCRSSLIETLILRWLVRNSRASSLHLSFAAPCRVLTTAYASPCLV